MSLTWPLPENDYWSTPFAKVLLHSLDLFPGATVLEVATGSGLPAFHVAEQVGPDGRVLAIDINPHNILHARSVQGTHLPWLSFEVGDMRRLPPSFPLFDRITGNLSFMFFRPNRYESLKNLTAHLKPGGQIVLTFPSRGTFDSLWKRVEEEMVKRQLQKERQALAEYIEERPSADQAQRWLEQLGLKKVNAVEWPLEIATGPGREFLNHPLLRGGFLDDIYECFADQAQAEEFMTVISEDIASFTPLLAQRCAISAWMPKAAL